MTTLTPLQETVFEAAKAKLESEPWFQGVCIDDFPTDDDIRENFQWSVIQVEMQTAYWDAPNFMGMLRDD